MEPDIIREIQLALRTISRFNPQIPLVVIDGIYSPQTADAVAIFQRVEELPITGNVDSVTFRRLIESAASLNDIAALPIPAFPHPAHLIRPYERSEIVPFLKAMLSSVTENYSNIPLVSLSDVYDEPSIEAVRILQRMHELEDNGIVDREVWNILVNLFATRPSLLTIPWSEQP